MVESGRWIQLKRSKCLGAESTRLFASEEQEATHFKMAKAIAKDDRVENLCCRAPWLGTVVSLLDMFDVQQHVDAWVPRIESWFSGHQCGGLSMLFQPFEPAPYSFASCITSHVNA